MAAVDKSAQLEARSKAVLAALDALEQRMTALEARFGGRIANRAAQLAAERKQQPAAQAPTASSAPAAAPAAQKPVAAAPARKPAAEGPISFAHLTPKGHESAVEKRLMGVCVEMKLHSSQFARVPADYYDWPLEKRRAQLNADSIDHLCKTIIMTNTRCKHNNFSDPTDSKYYSVVVQYTRRLNKEKLIKLVRGLRPAKDQIAKKNWNFRLVPEKISDELSGFEHNAVTPIGMKTQLPLIVSDECAKLDYIWLGGGEVDLKWRISTAQLKEHFKPIIGDITYAVGEGAPAGEDAE